MLALHDQGCTHAQQHRLVLRGPRGRCSERLRQQQLVHYRDGHRRHAAGTATVSAPAGTATATVTTPASTTTVRRELGASGSGAGLGDVPAYEPSTVVSRSARSLVLSSTDPVAKVGSFYATKLAGGGWVVVSKVVTPTSANFTVKKNGQGASVAVAPKAGGSSISISSYPIP
jgi:hypothetical protein